ncbi:MAG: caspase family protein [Vicinamibacteria bacterium]
MSDLTAASSTPQTGPSVLPFTKSHAFIVGIDSYLKVSPLKTAVNDARQLGQVLADKHRFTVHPPLLDATGADLHALLRETMKNAVGKDDRVVFYFAGHGIAADGDDGPTGYLVPADADPADLKTFVPMTELQDALQSLPCRHLLLILDCCFSGAFKWSSQTRAIGTLIPKRIYKERFDRFVLDPAWQVITSAAYDQKAMDVLQGRATGDRGLATAPGQNEAHSPFALALFEGLLGGADATTGREGDGVITATELYSYIRDRVEPQTLEAGQTLRQTPGFFPLRKHDKGEFIFLHPNHRLNLPPLPDRCPYQGLASFDEEDRLLFYGRDRVIAELQARCDAVRLLVVSGASGTGKSSVVKAGLLPRLRAAGYGILPVIRPGLHPLAAFELGLANIATAGPGAPQAVVLIDQFEEVITRCADEKERDAFMARVRQAVDDKDHIHRVIVTVRSDFEPQLSGGDLRTDWVAGRFTVPPFSLEELREVIVMPTIQEVLIFDPPELVDEIVEDVVQSPGALPLLSFALSELYDSYRKSGRQDRALRKTDYDQLDGVMGALRTKADSLYQSLPAPEQATMRKIMLRMVSAQGDLAARRVQMSDLDYSTEENSRVRGVIERLVEARLVVKGQDYIEPAHDALVRAWKTLHEWIQAVGRESLILGERLDPEADEFAQSGDRELLWNNNPNLALAARELKNPLHRFNAKEVAFVLKSVARNRRKSRIAWSIAILTVVALGVLSLWALIERGTAQINAEEAQAQKDRALLSLFEGLSLNMKQGQPGSVCVYGLCADAPPGDADEAWLSLGRLPENMPQSFGEKPVTREFAALRSFGRGSVVVYAHDGLASDAEIDDGADNLLFAQNALGWLSPLNEETGCAEQKVTIVLWEGTFVRASQMTRVQSFIERRGWTLKVTTPETLEADLHCAEVLWYLSDWTPPTDFADRQVPQIERFVTDGGGLLVGGLGWSYDQQGGPDQGAATEPYAANLLGDVFGFEFTKDAFTSDGDKLIKLSPGRKK